MNDKCDACNGDANSADCGYRNHPDARDAEIARLADRIENDRFLFARFSVGLKRYGVTDGDDPAEMVEQAVKNTTAARDVEIAALRSALADAQSTLATVEQSLAVQTARGMEIAAERDCLADRVAAMGAAMQPFAAMSRHVKGMRDEERIFGISFVPGEGTAHVTAGHLRACQPHALDSAAAVFKAARDYDKALANRRTCRPPSVDCEHDEADRARADHEQAAVDEALARLRAAVRAHDEARP